MRAESNSWNTSWKRLLGRVGLSRFGVLQLLYTVIFIPIAIGVVLAFYDWAAFGESFVWPQQQRESLDRLIVNRLRSTDSVLSKNYYFLLITILNFCGSWIGTACGVGFYAWIRSILARRFAKILILSVPIVQVIVAELFHSPSLHTAIGAWICVGLAMIPSLLVYLLLATFRPVKEVYNEVASRHRVFGRWAVTTAIVVGTLLLSACGWQVAITNGLLGCSY